MRPDRLLLLVVLATETAAQADFFSSLLSEAGSIFTQVTSALGNPNTATKSSSATTTSSTSSSSSSTTSSTSTTSSASAAATSSLSSVSSTSTSSTSISSSSSIRSTISSATSSISSTSSHASTAAAQTATTSATASAGSGNSTTLPIVLGCTLGALALAALLALLFLCRRRRRRNNRAVTKHRPLSATEEDVDGWRHEKPFVRSFKTPVEHTTPVGTHASGAPLMSEYPHNTHSYETHQNPFTPAPPPARRSNSRAGLQGPAYYSAQPFSADDYHPQNGEIGEAKHGHTTDHHDGHHKVTAGVGGLALGGLAVHAIDKHEHKKSLTHDHKLADSNRESTFSETQHNILPESVERRSGSVSRASLKEPWPFVDAQERKSTDSARSRARSFSRSRDRFTTPDSEVGRPSKKTSIGKMAGVAALGGLAGAAIARKSGSKSPRRKSILKQTTSDSSEPMSISSDSRKSIDDPTLTTKRDVVDGPHELAVSDIPPAPLARERRNSTLGTAAPAAAIGSYVDEKTLDRSRNRRSGSGGAEHEPVPPLPLVIPRTPPRNSADYSIPAVPNRSPRRRSITPNARYSTATEGTAEMPAHSVERSLVSPPLDAHRYSDNGGLVSPVSPINRSNSGLWSGARIEEHALPATTESTVPGIGGSQNLSQDSTAVVTLEPVSDHSTDQSSGLVSAIQQIFGAQRASWTDHDDIENAPVQRRIPADISQSVDYPVQSIPHRKPAPQTYAMPPSSYPRDFQHERSVPGNLPGSWTPTNPEQRDSSESTRSFPLRSRSRGNSHNRTRIEPTQPIDTTIVAATRPRKYSRPGYGFGSGDPFDLATMRTDSNMTGVSLSSYHTPPTHPLIQPSHQRPAFSKRESSSSDYREPTLAQLRQQVIEDDKVMARQQWRRSRSISAGRRHGDDGELFDLAMPDQDNLPFERERIYGPEKAKKRSLEQERSARNSQNSGSVGWAY